MLSSPDLSEAVSQNYLRCCLLGCSPHSAPNKTTRGSLIVHFLVNSHYTMNMQEAKN